MTTFTHCRVCGGLCVTSRQIASRLCAKCIEQGRRWTGSQSSETAERRREDDRGTVDVSKA